MQEYHHIWATDHGISLEWLQYMLDQGFHIHHIDKDRENNEPNNLVLIFGDDHHKKLHNLPIIKNSGKKKGGRPKKEPPEPEVFRFKKHASRGSKY